MSGLRVAVLMWLLALPALAPQRAQAQAEGPVCAPTQETVRNRDGSRLRLRTTCRPAAPAPGEDPGDIDLIPRVDMAIDYAARGVDMFTEAAVVGPGADGEALLRARFFDVDGDGFHEVEARGMCGAGPNCLGDLYRLDPRTGAVRRVFSGGYAQLSILDGHLVESGRASCCAWEFHAWPWFKAGAPDPVGLRDDASMALMVEIGPDVTAEGVPGEPELRCAFRRRSGDTWRLVRPPGRAWLRFCATYDAPYRLLAPDRPGAAPPTPETS